jgi:hypothetical protein
MKHLCYDWASFTNTSRRELARGRLCHSLNRLVNSHARPQFGRGGGVTGACGPPPLSLQRPGKVQPLAVATQLCIPV